MAETDLSKMFADFTITPMDGVWQMVSQRLGLVAKVSYFTKRQRAKMQIQEREGLTLVLRADGKTPQDNRWSWIEISVYSDLHAVGFLARIAAALASAGVPCNAFAGFNHDHILVPEDKREIAVKTLNGLKN